MSDTKPNQTTTPTPTTAPPKKEEYPPLPPGQPGNPRQYTPVKVDGRKNPRKKEAFAAREKKALKRGKPRQLPPLTLTRDAYKDVFRTAGDIEAAINKYRDMCQGSGDMPTLNGFCLSCGGNSTLLSSYIDGSDKSLARAAQAVADWIIEQMDQAVINGTCPVNYAQHLGVNQYGRVNSRTYTESNNKSVVDNQHTLSSIIDKADTGGLPAPPGAVKRIGTNTDKQRVIELEPIRDTRGQSRPGSKAAERVTDSESVGRKANKRLITSTCTTV
jgi:hypothetical protein